MTYREAQAILEKEHFTSRTTLIQEMVYQGWVAPNQYGGAFRNWDDEITEEDRAALNKRYGQCVTF